ncbi:hypothetical protein [Raoultella terrigena]|uniref:hypothetical protein n=1 Tax=Raoultella terrigena TaxID=577 RepID=UPI001F492932|nr:hypothetical protein [Raoultella terrigena]
MQSLKIEYVNGVLVSLERDGKSYMGLPVSTVHFTHSMKTTPYLKVEIEAGGEPYTPPAKQAPAPAAAPASARVIEQPPAREGELLPQEENQKQRSRRNRNHRNHRSQ